VYAGLIAYAIGDRVRFCKKCRLLAPALNRNLQILHASMRASRPHPRGHQHQVPKSAISFTPALKHGEARPWHPLCIAVWPSDWSLRTKELNECVCDLGGRECGDSLVKKTVQRRRNMNTGSSGASDRTAHDHATESWIDRVARLEKFLTICPRDILGRCDLASVLEELGQHEEALLNWNAVISCDPNNLKAREGMARCRLRIGQLL
jgi:hypothetical protein